MTEAYDGNGDYSSYNDEDNDYKQRKGGGGGGGGGNVGVGGSGPGISHSHNGDNSSHDHHGGGPGAGSSNVIGGPNDGLQLNDKANEYIRDCLTEKKCMDRKFPIAEKLLDSEIEKVQSTGRIPSRDQKYADIYREKPLRVSQKVLVPIREHPKFNFVGKLLGPKGNSLRRLQEETLCKMTVLGRNSMRDRAKEEELRASQDPKYAHLNSDLHVEISTIAPPAEAYARIAYAMAELRKYLIPDSNDGIRQEQLRELMDNTGISDHDVTKPLTSSSSSYKKPLHQPLQQQQQQQHQSIVQQGGVMGGIGGGGGGGGIGVGATGSGMQKNIPHHGYRPPPQPSFAKNSIPPKQKVMSILEKARTAMDETYGRGYDEQATYEPSSYDTYSYGHGPSHGHTPHGQPGGSGIGSVGGGGGGRGPYDTQEYEPDYNRRDYYQHSPNFGGGAGGVTQTNQSGVLNPNHNRSHVNR